MKVKALQSFSDKDNNKLHMEGEIFEVTKDRFTEINSTEYGDIVEQVEVTIEDVKTTKKK